jgi:cyclopropane fatty-acyl-phospholipid synthase-like methyltransferase
MEDDYRQQSKNVAEYYNQWQHAYDAVYGDTIQAFRPADKEELMMYIAGSADIHEGQYIVDAGCGIGGPAIWIAKKFEVKISGITVSELQAEKAKKSIGDEGLSKRIEIYHGDYHELVKNFPASAFDRALFLESLGHAADPAKVIHQAFEVLKPGGSIYIKDFYSKEPADEYWKRRTAQTIANINRLYNYNTLTLARTISALRAAGFEIDFIRKFAFTDDISIRLAFESRFGIDIFGGEPEFTPAEWLEIKCIKPLV